MKEDFMHYIWRFKLLNTNNLLTFDNQKIEIINFGSYTQKQGPDFFNALIKINNQLWAGNVEIHVKASDWYVHHHELDLNYNNVILHVVWEYDTDVFYSNNQKIPVLVLKNYVSNDLINKYTHFFSSTRFIPCQNQIKTVPNYIWDFYKERLFIERLEFKVQVIDKYIKITQSNWEQITFIALCKGFGLNTNGEIFEEMALKIPFTVFLKVKSNAISLESLFFGMLNMLPDQPTTDYEFNLLQEFKYLKHKFNLQPLLTSPSFYQHRPDNFPTIRLAQLANLFSSTATLFDSISNVNTIDELYQIFNCSTSNYWKNHYTFQSVSKHKIKKTTSSFIQLVIINSVIPLLYGYSKCIDKQNTDDLIQILKFLPSEKNNTILFFDKLQISTQSAFDSQVLIHLKKNYCDTLQCLHCAIGKYLIQ